MVSQEFQKSGYGEGAGVAGELIVYQLTVNITFTISLLEERDLIFTASFCAHSASIGMVKTTVCEDINILYEDRAG